MEKKSKEENIENRGINRVESNSKSNYKNDKKYNNKNNTRRNKINNNNNDNNNNNGNYRRKTNKKKKHLGLRIFLAILLILLIAGAVFAVKVVQNGGGMQGVLKTSLGHDNDTVNKLEKLYCLILGQSENLTDTIMLASYDPKTQEAALLSIPRDTFIGNDVNYASTWDKINAVYQNGAENTLKEVRELTGINVQYYLKVDTEALKVLVDEIGGVYFDVPIDMHYTDKRQNLYIDLKAGYQLLDGDKAEQVVRFRHNSDGSTYPYEYGGEDLGRMRTQRAFLTELIEQCLGKMDLNTILSFLDIMEKYVETNLDFDAIKDYVPYVIDFKIDNLKTATLPGESGQAPNGLWFYFEDEEESEQIINELFYGAKPENEKNTDTNTVDENTVDSNSIDDENTVDESEITVEVLNGSGDTNNLSEVVKRLEAEGFTVAQTGNTSITSNTTIIDRNNTPESSLKKIKEIAGVENVSTGDASATSKVTIIIGTDYVM